MGTDEHRRRGGSGIDGDRAHGGAARWREARRTPRDLEVVDAGRRPLPPQQGAPEDEVRRAAGIAVDLMPLPAVPLDAAPAAPGDVAGTDDARVIEVAERSGSGGPDAEELRRHEPAVEVLPGRDVGDDVAGRPSATAVLGAPDAAVVGDVHDSGADRIERDAL